MNKSQIATMRDNYDQLREKFDAQLEPSYCNPHDLQEQVSLCATHWDSLCNLLSQDVGKPVEDADKWLSEVEAQLEKNGPLYHRSTDVDAKQLTPLKVKFHFANYVQCSLFLLLTTFRIPSQYYTAG